ncbi:hypothetical protein Mp_1g10600 [Marchantia polymorpha subsp. ruderalis]|uniref:Uncharacterized protein n=2 Tax=Marchantia polymorpha TaxID=3197 RepID=A0AAF6ANQ0_MARPO|nr:hypothetical protein MARPO_0014s0168 [Marchantia polymorpha]BBM98070.1 hypothetical protein Mp_1g10600 [Marchantia polymorpha subsp. ruderalis]|eukprot:PTQ45657.1 hypothetical protein MARPO_0014s0168 [Marchantia polymorpha]
MVQYHERRLQLRGGMDGSHSGPLFIKKCIQIDPRYTVFHRSSCANWQKQGCTGVPRTRSRLQYPSLSATSVFYEEKLDHPRTLRYGH